MCKVVRPVWSSTKPCCDTLNLAPSGSFRIGINLHRLNLMNGFIHIFQEVNENRIARSNMMIYFYLLGSCDRPALACLKQCSSKGRPEVHLEIAELRMRTDWFQVKLRLVNWTKGMPFFNRSNLKSVSSAYAVNKYFALEDLTTSVRQQDQARIKISCCDQLCAHSHHRQYDYKQCLAL